VSAVERIRVLAAVHIPAWAAVSTQASVEAATPVSAAAYTPEWAVASTQA
jgi:hypothetical protein